MEKSEKKSSNDRVHIKTWRIARDILYTEVGKKKEMVRPRFEYFYQIIKDIGCENFREMKELAWWLR